MPLYTLINHRGETIQRKTRTSAAARLYGMVYAAIRANAGLDTQWGHNAASAARLTARYILDGAPVGWSHKIQIGPYADTVSIGRMS